MPAWKTSMLGEAHFTPTLCGNASMTLDQVDRHVVAGVPVVVDRETDLGSVGDGLQPRFASPGRPS